MKPILLHIPDSLPERQAWLERQLVGLELGELVVELQAVHQSRPQNEVSTPSLEEAFVGLLPQIMEHGLSVLTEKQLGLLLKNPSLLRELQDAVLEHGSYYWDTVPRSEEFEQRLADSREILSTELAGQSTLAPALNPIRPEHAPSVTGRSGSPRRLALKLVAIAAALFVGITFWMTRPSVPTWGFDRSGILSANLSSAEYLNALATAAGDWFNKRPEEKTAVATRLRQFIHGCDTLINAPHSQLSPEDRAWLIERCRIWKSKLESQLADLEAKRSSAAEVRDTADKTILDLQNALRERAKRVA